MSEREAIALEISNREGFDGLIMPYHLKDADAIIAALRRAGFEIKKHNQ